MYICMYVCICCSCVRRSGRKILGEFLLAVRSHLDIAVSVNQKILRLEVSVHNLVLMAILYPRKDLKEKGPCLILRHTPAVGQKVEKIPARTVVQHHVDLLFRLNALVQPANMRMCVLGMESSGSASQKWPET